MPKNFLVLKENYYGHKGPKIYGEEMRCRRKCVAKFLSSIKKLKKRNQLVI